MKLKMVTFINFIFKNNNKIGVKLIKELLLGDILVNPAPPIPSKDLCGLHVAVVCSPS